MDYFLIILVLFLFIISSTLLLFFLFLFLHETGHYITGRIYNYQPSALVFDYYVIPGATTFFEDIEKTNTIFKLSGLIFQILYVLLLAIIFGLSSLWFRAFGISFLILSPLSSLNDIQLVLENNLDIKKISILDKVTKWFSERKRNAPSLAIITSEKKWKKWKKKYPKDYESIDKEIFLPWA